MLSCRPHLISSFLESFPRLLRPVSPGSPRSAPRLLYVLLVTEHDIGLELDVIHMCVKFERNLALLLGSVARKLGWIKAARSIYSLEFFAVVELTRFVVPNALNPKDIER